MSDDNSEPRSKKMDKTWKNERFTPSSTQKMRARAAVAAKLIVPNSSVLDVGCGLMLIRSYLPKGSIYEGYDRYPALPEVKQLDLDALEFPSGQWDYIILLGVLAWIERTSWTLSSARSAGKNLIITRSSDKFDGDITQAGWTLKSKLPYSSNSGEIDICLYE